MAEGTIEQLLKQLESGEPEAAWTRFLEDYAALIYGVVRHFEPDDDRAADCFQFVCEQLVRDRFRRLRRFDPRGPASFPTWLRAVVRHLCLDHRRQKFGRLRVFRSISRLSALDQEVFRCYYERGHSAAEAALFLTPRFPFITPTLVRESLGRIEEELTASQRWRLGARALLSRGRSRAEGPKVKSPELADTAPDPEDRAARREALRALARAFKDLTPRERLLVRLRFEEELTLEQIARLLDLGNAQRADRQLREIIERLRKSMAARQAEAGGGKIREASVKDDVHGLGTGKWKKTT